MAELTHAHKNLGTRCVPRWPSGLSLFCDTALRPNRVGKTYTMGTCSAKINSGEWKDSVIQKLIKDIYEEIHQETERDFMMRVSLIEIHNEEIKDLLNANKNDEIALRIY